MAELWGLISMLVRGRVFAEQLAYGWEHMAMVCGCVRNTAVLRNGSTFFYKCSDSGTTKLTLTCTAAIASALY